MSPNNQDVSNLASSSLLFFFVGTIAELIKLMPVMKACSEMRLSVKIIVSGQNDVAHSELLAHCSVSEIAYNLSAGLKKKNALGLFFWFFQTLVSGYFLLRKEFKAARKLGGVVVVHGDTVSTVMGAVLAKMCGLTVAHVEAGLRSYNLLQPFPEELDRIVTSRMADIHFSPGAWAENNLVSVRGQKVNTYENTLIDALGMVNGMTTNAAESPQIDGKYFVFVLHRQENLLNSDLVRALLNKVSEKAKEIPCVFIMHHLTLSCLQRLGLYDDLLRDKNIALVPRLPYAGFMRLLSRSDFVVTDGGSNQEECFYLGKPCLILRKVTERMEGLSHNAVLSGLDTAAIDAFLADPYQYAKAPVCVVCKPSEIIAQALLNFSRKSVSH